MLDNRGQTIQAHGGGFLHQGEQFYWFGEDKHGRSEKDSWFQGISCYSSRDLQHWKFEQIALAPSASGDLGPRRIVERPKVLFNRTTHRYVMWLHIDDARYAEAKAGVAVSDRPCGPYTYLRSLRPLGFESRDIGLFADNDGSGFLLTEDRKHGLRIDRLSADYEQVTEAVATLADLEAPALFKAGDRYILLGSFLSGWKPNDNQYWTASDLFGPWSKMTPLAPPGTNTYGSQTASVLTIRGSKGTAYIYVGDRWNPQALGESGYIWLPLDLKRMGMPLMDWHPEWRLDLRAGTWTVSQ